VCIIEIDRLTLYGENFGSQIGSGSFQSTTAVSKKHLHYSIHKNTSLHFKVMNLRAPQMLTFQIDGILTLLLAGLENTKTISVSVPAPQPLYRKASKEFVNY